MEWERQPYHRSNAVAAKYRTTLPFQPCMRSENSLWIMRHSKAELRIVAEAAEEQLAGDSLCETARMEQSPSNGIDRPDDSARIRPRRAAFCPGLWQAADEAQYSA